jgi:hypothetical protein
MTASPIASFFESFARQSGTDNIQAQVSQFADTFLAAGPHGVKCATSADFTLAIPKRKQLFDSLGCQSTTLVGLEETPLDTRYVLVRTKWKLTFRRPDTNPECIVVDSTFIVDAAASEFKIVFYLANQDIMQVLKDRGIAPA